MMPKEIPIEKRIILALDVPTVDEAKKVVKRLEKHIRFYKVGMQLFLAGWFGIVDWILERGHEVFLDLKFYDVPQTVKSATEQLISRDITFITVHGDDKIMQAACAAKKDLKVLAVTVLTSMDNSDLEGIGYKRSVQELVLSRARRAVAIGCDGVVASGWEARMLRKHLGEDFFVVTPGIRPFKDPVDDQKRIVTAKEAFESGADHVVIGRPIRNAQNPEILIERMQQDIEEALKASR